MFDHHLYELFERHLWLPVELFPGPGRITTECIDLGRSKQILIDFDNLALGMLEVHRDLPAGGSRVLQKARGYVGTFVAGTRTRHNDTDTGKRPGRLVRSG